MTACQMTPSHPRIVCTHSKHKRGPHDHGLMSHVPSNLPMDDQHLINDIDDLKAFKMHPNLLRLQRRQSCSSPDLQSKAFDILSLATESAHSSLLAILFLYSLDSLSSLGAFFEPKVCRGHGSLGKRTASEFQPFTG